MQFTCEYSTHKRDNLKQDNSWIMHCEPSYPTSVCWYDKQEEKSNLEPYITSCDINQINEINKKKVYPYYFSTDSNSSFIANEEKTSFSTDPTSKLNEVSMMYLSCPTWNRKESGENFQRDVCHRLNCVNDSKNIATNPMKISFQITKPSHYPKHQQKFPITNSHAGDSHMKPCLSILTNSLNQCKKHIEPSIDSKRNRAISSTHFYQHHSNCSVPSHCDTQPLMSRIGTFSEISSKQNRNAHMDKASDHSHNQLTDWNLCDLCRTSGCSLSCDKKRTSFSSFSSTPKRSDFYVSNKNAIPCLSSIYKENGAIPLPIQYSSYQNPCSAASSSSSSTACSSTPLSLSAGIGSATPLSTPCVQLNSPVSKNFLTKHCSSSTTRSRSSSPTFENMSSPYIWKRMRSSPVKEKYVNGMEAHCQNSLTQCNKLNELSTSDSQVRQPVTGLYQYIHQNTLPYQFDNGTFLNERLVDTIHQKVKNTNKPSHDFSCHPQYQVRSIDSNYPQPKQNQNGMIQESLQSLPPLNKSWFQNINTLDIMDCQLPMPPECTYNFDAKLTVCSPPQNSHTLNGIKTKGSNGRNSTEYLCSFPGVSWNTRMQSWLVYYEDINGRKSKTFNPKRYTYDKLSSYGLIDENLRQYSSLSLAMHCACAFAAKVRYRAKLYKHSGVTMGRSGVRKPQKSKAPCLKNTPCFNEFIIQEYSHDKKPKCKNITDKKSINFTQNCPIITRPRECILDSFNNREPMYTDVQFYNQNSTCQSMTRNLSFNQ